MKKNSSSGASRARPAASADDIGATRVDGAADSIGDCPLCGRPMHLATSNKHHLVPKSRGGRETQYLHRVCHRKLHATFSEKSLAREFNTVVALLANPEIAAFVEWIRTKPIDFYSPSRRARNRT